jgi:hypothetical protein
MAIHDVDMDDVGPCGFDSPHLFRKATEICR